jgi:hypothetical protein
LKASCNHKLEPVLNAGVGGDHSITSRRSACLLMLLMLVSGGCGQAGLNNSSYSDGELGAVRGSLVASSGDQGNLVNWVVAMMERDTGVSRVGVINAAGIYNLVNVNMGVPSTLVLLTPDFKFSSVLAITGAFSGTIRQFFMPQAIIPKLIHRGEIMTFFSEDGLSVTSDIAADGDSDLIPDGLDPDIVGLRNLGLEGFAPSSNGLQLLASEHDFDLDGVPDIIDPDIDGEGIPNWFDTNEDGDEFLDVFDGDANGNIVMDSSEQYGSLYFKEGIDFLSVQVERSINATGTVASTVTIAADLMDGVTPLAVDIRGAPSLFNGASINNITTNSEGLEEIISGAWDKRLLDDGLSNDSSADDRVFGRKVVLQTGKQPTANQVMFLRLAFGGASNAWFKEYPFIFSDLTLANIVASYSSSLRRVSFSGTPFGSVTSYKWFVDISGTITEGDVETTGIIHTSSAIEAVSTKNYTIPADTLESGVSYTVTIRAQALDRIPGAPSYTVKSAPITITGS